MAEIKKRVINTTKSIKEVKTDDKLQSEQLKKAQGISKSPRKQFKCSSIYAGFYPNGFITTYQGIIVELIFDNRVVELPEVIIDFIERKIQDKADKVAYKNDRFKTKKQDKLGEFQAE